MFSRCPECAAPVRVNGTDRLRKHHRRRLNGPVSVVNEECPGSGWKVASAVEWVTIFGQRFPAVALPGSRYALYVGDYHHTDEPLTVVPASWVDVQ
jgi:hypothetical protein